MLRVDWRTGECRLSESISLRVAFTGIVLEVRSTTLSSEALKRVNIRFHGKDYTDVAKEILTNKQILTI